MGAAYRDHLEAASAEAEVGTVMRFGVSTVRPSEDPRPWHIGWAVPE
jgi:hypothetical protein